MSHPDPAAVPAPGLCAFAAARLLPLIDAFFMEIGHVRAADDPEAVHRLRVASRRLRAAMPLFSFCFSEKEFHGWLRAVKRCTRALGSARDTDVRIAFLKKYLKARRRDTADNEITKPDDDKDRDPLVKMLKSLQKERKDQQEELTGVLDGIERTGDLLGLQEACRALAAQKTRRKPGSISGILPVAAERIGTRLISPRLHEPFVHSPYAVPEHHALRIEIKKLRYTLETYAPLYRRGMAKQIAQLKSLQDLLGDLHDCDVWIDDMTRAILEIRSRKALRELPRKKSLADIGPLRRLLDDREKARGRLYRRFVRRWDVLVRAGFWDGLKTSVLDGHRSIYRRSQTVPAEEVETAFCKILERVPGQQTHSLQVMHLADHLFTELAPLHGLGDSDRSLLRYAAIVHDIGWAGGGTGHHERGADQILAENNLPVSVREQGIIALLVGLHGGEARIRDTGFYRLLPAADQKRVLFLAAILRIADGLDYTHDSCVTGVHCDLRENEILCELTGTGNTGPCRERGLKKSDLLCKIGKTTLVMM